MKNTCIVGAQWGDEGKGKITDVLAEQADIVARYSGGNNAGHTIVIDDQKIKLHHIPSGILHKKIKCILGNGMVINLPDLKDEVEGLHKINVSTDNLYISQNAHLIMPYHIMIDGAQEEIRGKNKIGTTKKGIGPAYTDKAARIGIRMIDLEDKQVFKNKLEYHFKEKAEFITAGTSVQETFEKFLSLYEYFKEKTTDTSLFLYNELSNGKKALFEGAQGALLDLDLGTYPFVTSASTTSGGVGTGLGIPSAFVEKVIGVAKAYTTRVGTGPFPTEDTNEVGKLLLDVGAEYGTTTGRARRCGYLDLVILKYAKRINGLNAIAVTKLDVLTNIKTIKVATAYKHKNKTIKDFPQNQNILAECVPIYQELPCWTEDISSCLTYDELPKNAKKYVEFMENSLDIPVSYVSVGPGRAQTIKK